MPSKPDWFDKELEKIAGKNIFGDSNLRIVWGASQRDHNGKYKYVFPDNGKPMNCWVLERWMPPGFFGGKEAWERDRMFYDDVSQKWVDLKGSYPTRGGYVMITPLCKEDGSHIPADWDLLYAVKRRIRKDEEFASQSMWKRNDLIQDEFARQQRLREQEADKRQEDIREYHLKHWDEINRSVTRGYSITPR